MVEDGPGMDVDSPSMSSSMGSASEEEGKGLKLTLLKGHTLVNVFPTGPRSLTAQIGALTA